MMDFTSETDDPASRSGRQFETLEYPSTGVQHVSSQVSGSAFLAKIFEQWLGLDTPDRILIDRQGVVVWCRILTDAIDDRDRSFIALHTMRVGGTLPSDLLLPILSAGNLALPGQSRIALIERTDARENLMARVTPLGNEKLGLLGVTITARHGFSKDTCADLKRFWDLSAGETRVLSMTFQGLTVQEVAEASELSIETIRTHIRNIYAKVGVNSREALFATVNPAIS